VFISGDTRYEGHIFSGTTNINDIYAFRTLRVSEKIGAYTLTPADHVIIANSAVAFQVTLPNATDEVGRQFIIKNKGSADITIDASGLGGIDGGYNVVAAQYDSYTLLADGTNWNIL